MIAKNLAQPARRREARRNAKRGLGLPLPSPFFCRRYLRERLSLGTDAQRFAAVARSYSSRSGAKRPRLRVDGNELGLLRAYWVVAVRRCAECRFFC